MILNFIFCKWEVFFLDWKLNSFLNHMRCKTTFYMHWSGNNRYSEKEGSFVFQSSPNYGSFYKDSYWVATCIPLLVPYCVPKPLQNRLTSHITCHGVVFVNTHSHYRNLSPKYTFFFPIVLEEVYKVCILYEVPWWHFENNFFGEGVYCVFLCLTRRGKGAVWRRKGSVRILKWFIFQNKIEKNLGPVD